MINLYYFKTMPGNFGDELSNYIVPRLFEKEINLSSYLKCDAVFIGSLLDVFFNKSRMNNCASTSVTVWGTGFIRNPSDYTTLYRPLNLRAVRGLYTKQKFESIYGRTLYNLALGDPGILISECFKYLDIKKEYDYGIIPHYVDQNDPNLSKIKLGSIKYINIRAPIEEVVKDVLSCKNILSSAMHGLIVADSFGIPNRRLKISDKICGGDFKFNDYYSAFGLSQPEPIDLRAIPILDHLNIDYKITTEAVNNMKQRLIESFPYKK